MIGYDLNPEEANFELTTQKRLVIAINYWKLETSPIRTEDVTAFGDSKTGDILKKNNKHRIFTAMLPELDMIP